MNSAGGRCHDNSRCESIRGLVTRMKNELFYSRGRRSTDYTTEQLKTMIWRYYMSYWNNRRICSSIGGMPPAEKRRRYYSDKTGKSAAAMKLISTPLRFVDIYSIALLLKIFSYIDHISFLRFALQTTSSISDKLTIQMLNF